MKTAIYNGKLITPAEVLENKVLVLENDRIIDILAEDVIDLGQYDEKIDAHGRYVCPGFIDTHSDKIEQIFLCQVGTKKILRIYKPFIGGQPPVNGLRFSMLFCRSLCDVSYTPLQTPPSSE